MSCTDSALYIPYAMMSASPITFYFGHIPITIRLCDQNTSLISVTPDFKIMDPLCQQSNMIHDSHKIRVGTSFILEYKGTECEVRIGRRIVEVAGDTHILL